MNVNRFLEAMLLFVNNGNGLRISFCKAYLFVHHEKVFLYPRNKGGQIRENPEDKEMFDDIHRN